MDQDKQPIHFGRHKPKVSFMRGLLMLVGVVFVFSLGIAIGKGSLTFGEGLKPVAHGLPENLRYTDVEALYDRLRKDFDGQLTEEQLMEGLKKGLVSATGDEYTEYLGPKEAQEFSNDLNGTFSGIGAELTKKDAYVVVVAPIAGFPAEKAGLRAQDVVTEINGQSAYGLSTSEAVSKIRGKVGTKVKLKVIRDQKELDFEITRETITVPSVKSRIEQGGIGYLQVSRFSDDTYRLSKQAVQEFKQKSVKGVVLDLRSNPGGLLTAAVDLSGLWLPTGKTVLQERRDSVTVKTYTSDGPALLEGVPTIVLIDEGSASASEITAGALKDNGAATLMGHKSFGKGSVQTLQELANGGVLKVTIAKWYTPHGKNIHKEGINPDTKVDYPDADREKGQDPQLNAALQALK